MEYEENAFKRVFGILFLAWVLKAQESTLNATDSEGETCSTGQ